VEVRISCVGGDRAVGVESLSDWFVLATSLKAWLAQPRRSDVRIRVQRDDGQTVEIDASRVDGERVDALVRQALGGPLSGE
jgi:hypothetical protein